MIRDVLDTWRDFALIWQHAPDRKPAKNKVAQRNYLKLMGFLGNAPDGSVAIKQGLRVCEYVHF